MGEDDNLGENIIKCSYELTVKEIFEIVTIENIDFFHIYNIIFYFS